MLLQGLAAHIAEVDASTPDADAAVFSAVVTVVSGFVGLVPTTVPVTFSGGCLGPFVDTSSGTGSISNPPCSNLATTSTGSYMAVSCTTGVLRGSASFTEPSGTSSIDNFIAAFVGGVGVIVASPLPPSSGGYTDDSVTGTLVGLAVMTPLPTTACTPPGAVNFGITAVFMAEYGGI